MNITRYKFRICSSFLFHRAHRRGSASSKIAQINVNRFSENRNIGRSACRHSQVINSGETATMNCTVEGYPVESVEWLHDGVPVLTAQDTRIRLLAPLVLVIGSVGRRDKGMYQCLVRSDKENAQATAELKLGGQRAHRSFFFLFFSF